MADCVLFWVGGTITGETGCTRTGGGPISLQGFADAAQEGLNWNERWMGTRATGHQVEGLTGW